MVLKKLRIEQKKQARAALENIKRRNVKGARAARRTTLESEERAKRNPKQAIPIRKPKGF
jgi:hypothetical protein